MMTPPALLFAAGFGTRMAPLTDHVPKPMVPVAGRLLLDHALSLVRDAGITRIFANTHYLANVIAPVLFERNVTALYEPELLETGGGLRNALPALGDGPVLTLNTDAVWTGDNPIPALLNAWDPVRMDGLLLVLPKDRATGHTGDGDFDLSGTGQLSRKGNSVYTGLQILNPGTLDDIEDQKFSLNLLWDRILARGRLYGITHPGGWCDVGRPESIQLAETLLRTDANV